MNNADLPSSWVVSSLGAVVNYGRTTKVEPSDIADDAWVLELEDIEKDSSRILQRLTFAQRQSKSTKSSFQAGDVLYGKLRPYLNKVVIADQAGYCTTEIIPIQAGQALDPRYLFYWLKHPAFLKYVEAESHGMNMPRLGTDTGKAAPFVLAPRGEQARIADQLDILFARIRACNDRFDAIPGLLRRFRQAVLDAAVSGALSEDWRGKSDEGDWSASTLAEICETARVITYGVVKLGEEVAGGTPCLRTSNVRWLRLDLTGMKRIAPNLSDEYARTVLKGDEVLVNVRGTLGGVSVVHPEMKGWNVSREVAVVPVDKAKIHPLYVAFWVASGASQRWLARMEKGVAYVGINIEDLRNLPIRVPSLLEQAAIAARVQSLLSVADSIEARHAAGLAQVQRLSPLILSKAFRGELVHQVPNDEPASLLLAQIAAQRRQAAAPTKARRPRGSRASHAPQETTTTMGKSRLDDDVMGHAYLASQLRRLGGSASAEALFKIAELPVADFYKQLAWEVAQGHVRDKQTLLEPRDAA